MENAIFSGKKLPLFLLAALLACGIFPVYHKIKGPTIIPEPVYNSYDSAISVQLATEINNLAKENKCAGYIRPLAEIDGNEPAIPNLREDLNLALASYKKWDLLLLDKARDEMKSRLDKNMKIWAGVLNGEDYRRIAMKSVETFKKAEYFTEARWAYLDGGSTVNADNVKLVLTIVRDVKGVQVFHAAVTFMHPAALRMLKENKNELERKRQTEKRINEVCLYLVGILAALIILVVLQRILKTLSEYFKAYRRRKWFKSEIEKRKELIDNGHFVTALQLADEYLAVFPQDIEIRAFRERLLDFTRHDPQAAQAAYVEVKKLKARMESFKSNPNLLLLNDNERQAMLKLQSYHPELSSQLEEVAKLEQQQQKSLEYQDKIREIEDFCRAGWLDHAIAEINGLPGGAMGEVEPLLSNILGRKKHGEERLQEALNMLCALQIQPALDIIKAVQQDYRDYEAANVVMNAVMQIKGEKHFILNAKSCGRNIDVLFQGPMSVSNKGNETVVYVPDKIILKKTKDGFAVSDTGTTISFAGEIPMVVFGQKPFVLSPGAEVEIEGDIYKVELK